MKKRNDRKRKRQNHHHQELDDVKGGSNGGNNKLSRILKSSKKSPVSSPIPNNDDSQKAAILPCKERKLVIEKRHDTLDELNLPEELANVLRPGWREPGTWTVDGYMPNIDNDHKIYENGRLVHSIDSGACQIPNTTEDMDKALRATTAPLHNTDYKKNLGHRLDQVVKGKKCSKQLS